MKIVCLCCNKIIGEIEPLEKLSEVKAKCTECVAKATEISSRFESKHKLKDGQEVILDNGLKGILWAAKVKDERLSFGELLIEGNKYFCSHIDREKFQKYLESITNEQCDVSFLHSITCSIDSGPRRRKKSECQPEVTKDTSVQYNCTVKVNKQTIQSMYDQLADRMKQVVEILAQGFVRGNMSNL